MKCPRLWDTSRPDTNPLDRLLPPPHVADYVATIAAQVRRNKERQLRPVRCPTAARRSNAARTRPAAGSASRRAPAGGRQARRHRRRVASGLLVPKRLGESFSAFVLARLACRPCGGAFEPERTTARYCSARCRVAAWRGAKGGR